LTEFRWTTQREQAAQLVADDALSDQSIADKLGVTRQTLANWKREPAFQQRVAEHLEAAREAIRAEGIANRINRVNALNDRWNRMRTVIEERAEDEAMQDVPGGKTGLLVHQTKAIGTGANQTIIDEYAVDTGLLKELRAHEEQAAKELGQWTEKREDSGGLTIRVIYDDDTDGQTTQTA
jgi:DNA-binding XRE family transcriptional regulator